MNILQDGASTNTPCCLCAGVSGAGASLSTFTRISWTCTQCQRSCLPVRSESRCLCGHRLKEHDTPDAAAGRFATPDHGEDQPASTVAGSRTMKADSSACLLPLQFTTYRAYCGLRRCRSARCACKRFTYIVAEGAWILRCSCKHKHTDHDPNTWACCKSSCRCTCFHSPWTCNCNHSWSEHQQVLR